MHNLHSVMVDTLVGATHSFLGLGLGNLASISHKGKASQPKTAALEGLRKMRALLDLGHTQLILPPCPRPDWTALRRFGFTGPSQDILHQAFHEAPDLLAICLSSSSMWTANAGVFSPSTKTSPSQFTPANLISTPHRALETNYTTHFFKQLLPLTQHHPPVPPSFSDEGAANVLTLYSQKSTQPLTVFVHGKSQQIAFSGSPRQSLEAQQILARTHTLNSSHTLFLKQSQTAIDAGVFHNDVISTGLGKYMVAHETSFEDFSNAFGRLKKAFFDLFNEPLNLHIVRQNDLSLAEAIHSYFFNAQWIPHENGEFSILAPAQCQTSAKAKALFQLLKSKWPIRDIQFMEISESMMNGGGPACLRLHLWLNTKELEAIPTPFIATYERLDQLEKLVKETYLDHWEWKDLQNKNWLERVEKANRKVSRILGVMF